MQDYFRAVLDAAGYTHAPPTAEAVRECFEDYVDAGFWRDLDQDDLMYVTLDEMCLALLRAGGKFQMMLYRPYGA